VQQQIQQQFLQSSTARSSALPFTRWIQTNAALRSHGGGGGAGGALPVLLLFFLSLLLPSQIMLVFSFSSLFFCSLLMPSSLLFSSLLSGDLLFGFVRHHFMNYFTLDHNSFCDFFSAP
jgi:hypothetical protein